MARVCHPARRCKSPRIEPALIDASRSRARPSRWLSEQYRRVVVHPRQASRPPAPKCVGSAITNKAFAEKKIIGIGKRNDGLHEINAGGALWLPVDWYRRHGQP
jgi:hypothetical protein